MSIHSLSGHSVLHVRAFRIELGYGLGELTLAILSESESHWGFWGAPHCLAASVGSAFNSTFHRSICLMLRLVFVPGNSNRLNWTVSQSSRASFLAGYVCDAIQTLWSVAFLLLKEVFRFLFFLFLQSLAYSIWCGERVAIATAAETDPRCTYDTPNTHMTVSCWRHKKCKRPFPKAQHPVPNTLSCVRYCSSCMNLPLQKQKMKGDNGKARTREFGLMKHVRFHWTTPLHDKPKREGRVKR